MLVVMVSVAAGQVVVASKDLGPGTVLQASDMYVAALPPDAVPSQAFTDPGDLVGRVLGEPTFANAPLREERLAPVGASGLDALVPRGMVRVRVQLARATAVIRPWDLVDLVQISPRPCVVVEAVKVIAVEGAVGVPVSDPWFGDPAAAIHVVVEPPTVGSVAGLSPADTAVWVRSHGDGVKGSGPGMCDARVISKPVNPPNKGAPEERAQVKSRGAGFPGQAEVGAGAGSGGGAPEE